MAKQNTKAAPNKADAKSTPQKAPAEQPANTAPDQTQTVQEPDASTAPEQMPVQPEPTGTDTTPAPVPVETPAASTPQAPTKSPARGAGKTAKTIRETAAQAVAKQVFRSHPDRRTVYVTSDGTPFFMKCDAENHARTLVDQLVTPITNENHKA